MHKAWVIAEKAAGFWRRIIHLLWLASRGLF